MTQNNNKNKVGKESPHGIDFEDVAQENMNFELDLKTSWPFLDRNFRKTVTKCTLLCIEWKTE